jgi:hypothetical protein
MRPSAERTGASWLEAPTAGPRSCGGSKLGGAAAAALQAAPHRGDQLPLYAEQRLRPVHFDATDVEAAALERTELP